LRIVQRATPLLNWSRVSLSFDARCSAFGGFFTDLERALAALALNRAARRTAWMRLDRDSTPKKNA
jgi:hypothetical protein